MTEVRDLPTSNEAVAGRSETGGPAVSAGELDGGRLESGRSLVFVGGPPRSGTTLVQHMLDSHPEVLGTPELLYLPELLKTRTRLMSAIDSGLLGYFCNRSTMDRATYGFIDSLLGPVLSDTTARYVSEKTPSNALVFSELADLLPLASFIFVIRDPRAIVSSMLRVGERAEALGEGAPEYAHDVRTAIRTIREYLRKGFAFARAHPADCLVVRYEDIVRRPEETTRSITAFLDLDWDAQMLEPQRKTHAGQEALSRTGVWYDAESVNRPLDPPRVDGWKRELHPTHQLLTTRAFRSHPDLVEAGYDLDIEHLSRASQLTAMAGWALDRIQHRASQRLMLQRKRSPAEFGQRLISPRHK